MKKIMPIIVLLLVAAFVVPVKAQLATDSWGLGFGFKYPRLVSSNTAPSNTNYGAYISLQRNFSEHIALRLEGAYSHMESRFTDLFRVEQTTLSNIISGNLDFMYYLVPCEPVSPYIFVGGGFGYHMLDNYATTYLKDKDIVGKFNGGFGVEWTVSPEWKVVTEGAYNLTLNSELDGAMGLGEINGKDTYFAVNAGLLYYFSQGPQSKYCQLYSGITIEQEKVDYDRIEEMVKRHIPKEVVKEIVVEKPMAQAARNDNWVLVGVNFDFDKATLRPEAYPILLHATTVMLNNPDLKVEIQGHTDSIGSESYNQKLSEKRANAVKNYLLARGIAASRLSIKGLGESSPMADNNTADGRAMNRRIEFKTN
ncbi:MAG: OmpA family protein [Melioribacteraceae bacterium]|nr:OmpA family protein [Melioribacteraceae bacterium]